jgi:membrane protein YqaA with SNARE-associated domain
MENFNSKLAFRADMAKRVFAETRMFYYHRRLKILEGLLWIFGGVVSASLIASFFILRNSDISWIIFLKDVAAHVTSHISGSSLLGVLYTSMIGGLFFIFLPIEVFFGRFVASGQPFIAVLAIYLLGIAIAFTANYYIGMKLASVSKKLITPKKFYNLKGKVNKYGGITVFVFNAAPLPSQVLAAILGVFKYNKTRFYVYVLSGQIVKCTAIWAGVYYFL